MQHFFKHLVEYSDLDHKYDKEVPTQQKLAVGVDRLPAIVEFKFPALVLP